MWILQAKLNWLNRLNWLNLAITRLVGTGLVIKLLYDLVFCKIFDEAILVATDLKQPFDQNYFLCMCTMYKD